MGTSNSVDIKNANSGWGLIVSENVLSSLFALKQEYGIEVALNYSSKDTLKLLCIFERGKMQYVVYRKKP